MRLLSIIVSTVLGIGLAAASPATTPLPTQGKARTKIDPAFYKTLVRYTRFSAAALAIDTHDGSCPNPPYNSVVLGKQISNSTTDTGLTIFRADGTKELIVAFPGTSSAQDFVTDFNETQVEYQPVGATCSGCLVHDGFYGAWLSVRRQTRQALKGYLQDYPGYTVTITGHSLGGALAGLAYPDLKGAGLPVQKAYTYGQPRIGNLAFANFIDKLSGTTEKHIGDYYRTTHSYDGVPQLPAEAMGYHHSRTEFFELDKSATNLKSQSAGRTWRCYGQEALDCNDGRGAGGINLAHLYYSGIMMTGEEGCG